MRAFITQIKFHSEQRTLFIDLSLFPTFLRLGILTIMNQFSMALMNRSNAYFIKDWSLENHRFIFRACVSMVSNLTQKTKTK